MIYNPLYNYRYLQNKKNNLEEMIHTFYGCASITGAQRTQIINKQEIPGPGTYDPSKKDTKMIPLWTLKPKIQYTSCFYNSKQFVPAPGTYQVTPNQVNNTQWKNQNKKAKQKDIKPVKDKDRNYIQKSSHIIALQIPSFVNQKSGFSFGYRDQFTVHQRSPGPIYHIGQMEDEAKKKKINKYMNRTNGFGYGERNKNNKVGQSSPGPGNYSPSPQKMYTTSGNWTFSKSPRKNKYEYSIHPLGPGQYNPKIQNSSRSCKLKGRYKQAKMEDYDASPGSYQIPDYKCKRGVVFKAASSPNNQDKILNQGPSPFSYDANTTTLKRGGFSLGKKLNQIQQNLQNPGPGSYEVQTKIDDKSGGYMSRRPLQRKKALDIQDNFYKYNPKDQVVNFKYPQFSFSQSSSNTNQKGYTNLGPGSYNILRKSQGQSYSIGKDRRFKLLQKQKGYGNIKPQNNYYGATGYLPSYLNNTKRKLKSKQAEPSSSIIQKQNIPQKQN